MSDQHPPSAPGGPSEDRPAQPSPHGAPPPAPGYNPSYGSGPFGAQPYTAAYGAPRDPDRRPGTVTGAAVTTLIVSGLALLAFGLALVGMLVARDEFTDAMSSDPSFAATGLDARDAYGVVAGFLGLFALWCVVACVLAVLALRRSQGARIALVVSAALSAVVSLVAIASLVSGVVLVASVAVIVLLFTGGANEWYARRGPSAPGSSSGGWDAHGQQYSQQYGQPYGEQYPPPYGQASGQQYPQQPYGQQQPHGQEWPPAHPADQGPRDAGTGDGPDDRPVQKPWG